MSCDLELRREVRDLRLTVDALSRLIGERHVRDAIADLQMRKEHPITEVVGLSAHARRAIRGLWGSGPKVVTLEGLSFQRRSLIAGLPRVTAASMSKIDRAMEGAGLSWPAEEGPT